MFICILFKLLMACFISYIYSCGSSVDIQLYTILYLNISFDELHFDNFTCFNSGADRNV